MVLAFAVLAFGLSLPWIEIVLLLMLIPLSNFSAYSRFSRRLPERTLVGSLLALDTILLTAVLFQAGGPTNPFTIVYLLHVVLAAVMLSTRWTWTIGILSSVSFGTLFFNFRPVPEWGSHGTHHGFSLHLHGMLFAYLVVAFLVTYFLNRIVGDLRKKERTLERLQNNASSHQRLASLTTIAAGAAHELGTPLATIAVVTHELERRVAQRYSDKELLDDLRLLKEETARCKDVLQQLSEKTGDLLGEAPQKMVISDLINEAVQPLKFKSPIYVGGEASFVIAKVPRKSLVLAVRAVIKNAFEASQSTQTPVYVVASLKNKNEMTLEVRDQGSGMDAESLERVGEPFFSTKTTSSGMGLGVYLSKLTVQQLGGDFSIHSESGRGTRVKLVFPIDCSAIDEAA